MNPWRTRTDGTSAGGSEPLRNRESPSVRLLPDAFMKHLGGVRRLSISLLDALRDADVPVSVDPWLIRGLDVRAAEPSPARRAAMQLRAAASAARIGAGGVTDVAHALYYDPAALAIRGPVVVTVYDMIHERFGSDSSQLRRLKKLILNRADLVIAISQTTADDVMDFFPALTSVQVVYPGVTTNLMKLPASDAPRDHALFVGHRHNHKNFELVVDAYRCSAELRRLPLVLVGGADLTVEERSTLEQATTSPIRHYLNVSDDELSRLYDGAAVTVVPSTWEGFGLPVVEAMARRSPVACSDVGSLREVAGGHAVLFDPTSPRACAEAMTLAATSATDVIAAARQHAETFSWQASAEAHRAMYQALAP